MSNIRKWQVGGNVRDRLLGVHSKDIDYAVEAPDYESMVAWIRSQGTIYLEQPQFWTVRAHLPGKLPADFVLCRKDGQYSDGRRPDSVMVGSLADDLARRDFTVNAIAYDEDSGEYVDPHGGRSDLEARLLKCVGKAYDRFSEDALRLLRAVRFAICKGFRFDYDVVKCLKDERLLLKLRDNVSEERKREELHKCFAHSTSATLGFLGEFKGLTDAVFVGQKLWLMPTMKDA